MNNLEKFNHSVNVLLKGYLNGTLIHGFCNACAVGNLIADAKGWKISFPSNMGSVWKSRNGRYVIPCWDDVFVCDGGDGDDIQTIRKNEYSGKAKRQIDSTGYTWQELAKIEKSFESFGSEHTDKDTRMFGGLMSVVDVLAEIHNIDLTTKEQAKSLFVCEMK